MGIHGNRLWEGSYINVKKVNVSRVTMWKHCAYLDTWSGFEAALTAPWPSRGLHHFGNDRKS